MKSLFGNGFKGLSDSAFSGVNGSAYRAIGLDFRSEPGKIKVQQKLKKISSNTVTGLAKTAVKISDGKQVWFADNKAYYKPDNSDTVVEKMVLDSDSLVFSDIEYGNLGTGNGSNFAFFSPDGLKLYTFSRSQNFQLKQWDLSIPFSIKKKREVYYYNASDLQSAYFKNDRFFILRKNKVELYHYTSGSLESRQFYREFDLSSQVSNATDIKFNNDGSKMYILEGKKVFTYSFAGGDEWGGDIPLFRLLTVGAGGKGGGITINTVTSTNERGNGGSGGAGNAFEYTQLVLQPDTGYTVTVGQATNGTGEDTIAFGKVSKGGGAGANLTVEDIGQIANYNGLAGGSGGAPAFYRNGTAPSDKGFGWGGAVAVGSTHLGGGRAANHKVENGIAGFSSLHSDITGTNTEYATFQSGRGSDGTTGNGANATDYGQGGQCGWNWNRSSSTFTGGNGKQGIAILRYDGDDVDTISKTGDTATSVGDDTVLTWLSSGTFQYTKTVNLTYVSSADLASQLPEVPKSFTISIDKVQFLIGNDIFNFTTTGYNPATLVFKDKIRVYTFLNTITPEKMQQVDDRLIVSFITPSFSGANPINNYTIFTPITSEVNVLSAQVMTVERPSVVEKKKWYDTVGRTTVKLAGGFANIDSEGSPVTVSTEPQTILIGHGLTKIILQNNNDFTQAYVGEITGGSSTSLTTLGAFWSYQPGSMFSTPPNVDPITVNQVSVNTFQFKTGSFYISQDFLISRTKEVDKVNIMFREAWGLSGGYSLKLTVTQGGQTLGTVTNTYSDRQGVGKNETLVEFKFTTPLTVQAGDVCTMRIDLLNDTGISFNENEMKYLVAPLTTRVGLESYVFKQSTGSGYIGNQVLQMQVFSPTGLDEDEDNENIFEERVYFTTENMLFYIRAEDVDGDWYSSVVPVGVFKNGHKEHHPMQVQNLSLFIGDYEIMAEVDRFGIFIKQTNFNVENSEVIQTLAPFDTDLVVGTGYKNYGRILRWDTRSESWTAQDEIPEHGGVTAFLPVDNYLYAFAGYHGGMYFYNGAIMEMSQAVPQANLGYTKVNMNSVAYFKRTALFGLSNIDGNTVPQGVYGLGKYTSNYLVSMSLDFPVPSAEYENIEVGAMIVDEDDFYVAYKTATEWGIAKLDYTVKYNDAHLETMHLLNGELRYQVKAITDVLVPYLEVPIDTGVKIKVKNGYGDVYVTKNEVVDKIRKIVRLHNPNIPNTSNPQVRIDLHTNGNTAPVIEDVLFNVDKVGEK